MTKSQNLLVAHAPPPLGDPGGRRTGVVDRDLETLRFAPLNSAFAALPILEPRPFLLPPGVGGGSD